MRHLSLFALLVLASAGGAADLNDLPANTFVEIKYTTEQPDPNDKGQFTRQGRAAQAVQEDSAVAEIDASGRIDCILKKQFRDEVVWRVQRNTHHEAGGPPVRPVPSPS